MDLKVGKVRFQALALVDADVAKHGHWKLEPNKVSVYRERGILNFGFNSVEVMDDDEEGKQNTAYLDLCVKSILPMVNLALCGFHSSCFIMGGDLSRSEKEAAFKNIFFFGSESESRGVGVGVGVRVGAGEGFLGTLFAYLFSELEREKENPKETILTSSVKLSCFEIFGEQTRDLIPTSDGDGVNESMRGSKLRFREDKHRGHLFLDGLRFRKVTNPLQASDLAEEAYRNRMSLIAASALGYSGQLDSIHEVGVAGNLFWRIDVDFTVVSAATGNTRAIHSTIQITDFAAGETLTYAPSNELLMFLPQYKLTELIRVKRNVSAIEELCNGRPSECQELWTNVLQTCMRALSSVVRITRLLKERIAGDGALHIPFRDSHFTRILQPVLNGNFTPFCISLIGSPNTAQGPINALRLASELTQLKNFVWVTNSSTLSPTNSKKKTNLLKSNGSGKSDGDSKDSQSKIILNATPTAADFDEPLLVVAYDEDEAARLRAKQFQEGLGRFSAILVELRAASQDLKNAESRLGFAFEQTGCSLVSVAEATAAGANLPLPSPMMASQYATQMASVIPPLSPEGWQGDPKTPPSRPSSSSPKPNEAPYQEKETLKMISLLSYGSAHVNNIKEDTLLPSLVLSLSPSPSQSPRNRACPSSPIPTKVSPLTQRADAKSTKLPVIAVGSQGSQLADDSLQRDGRHGRGSVLTPRRGVRKEEFGDRNIVAEDAKEDDDIAEMKSGKSKDNKSGQSRILNVSKFEHEGDKEIVLPLPGEEKESPTKKNNLFASNDEMLVMPWSNHARALRKVEARNGEQVEDDESGDLTEPERLFLRAVSQSNCSEATSWLKRGVPVTVKNLHGRDSMQIAARNGDIPMLELLLSRGGPYTSRGPKGDTLIHLAAYNDHLKTFKFLLDLGTNIQAVDSGGQTVGHVASRRCSHTVLSYLVEEGTVDLEQEDFQGQTPYQLIPRVASDEDSIQTRLLFELANIHA